MLLRHLIEMNKISYGKEHDLIYGNYKVIIKRGYRYSTKIALPVIIKIKKDVLVFIANKGTCQIHECIWEHILLHVWTKICTVSAHYLIVVTRNPPSSNYQVLISVMKIYKREKQAAVHTGRNNLHLGINCIACNYFFIF